MGNAPANVKAVAQWVAPSVEEEGAAAAIEKFVLSKHQPPSDSELML
jgi:hypothetical protein